MRFVKIMVSVFVCLISFGALDLAQANEPKSKDGMSCELLPPTYRTDSSRLVLEKIAPDGSGLGPTGNTYFLIPRSVKSVIVHVNPASSDTGHYLVKLITRYTDDTIYEHRIETIIPKANQNYTWGPYDLMPSAVPADKTPNVFNVKVQENYTLDPDAKGFEYTVSVEGCN